MTPLVRELFNKGDRAFQQSVSGIPCFDCTGIIELSSQIMQELAGNSNGSKSVDHGGIFVPPADKFILEWKASNARYMGLAIKGVHPEYGQGLYCQMSNSVAAEEHDGEVWGFDGFILYDDESFGIKVAEQAPERSEEIMAYGLVSLACFVLAINAPCIRIDEQPIHKGRAKQARKMGFTLKPNNIVTIDKTRKNYSRDGDGDGTPKAFHFVRGHARRLHRGGYTSVKPHWRGDPSLGIIKTTRYEAFA